jgi:hypothetical protein
MSTILLEIQGQLYDLTVYGIPQIQEINPLVPYTVIFTGTSNKIEGINAINYEEVKQLQEFGNLSQYFCFDPINIKGMSSLTSVTELTQDDISLISAFNFNKNSVFYSYESIVWNYFYKNTTYKNGNDNILFIDYVKSTLFLTYLDSNNTFKFSAFPISEEELTKNSDILLNYIETFIIGSVDALVLKKNKISFCINNNYIDSKLEQIFLNTVKKQYENSAISVLKFDIVSTIKKEPKIGLFYTYLDYSKILTAKVIKKFQKYIIITALFCLGSFLFYSYSLYNKGNIELKSQQYQNEIKEYNKKIEQVIKEKDLDFLLTTLQYDPYIYNIIESILNFKVEGYTLTYFNYDKNTNLIHIYFSKNNNKNNQGLLIEDLGKIFQAYMKKIYNIPINLRLNTVFGSKNSQITEITLDILPILKNLYNNDVIN